MLEVEHLIFWSSRSNQATVQVKASTDSISLKAAEQVELIIQVRWCVRWCECDGVCACDDYPARPHSPLHIPFFFVYKTRD